MRKELEAGILRAALYVLTLAVIPWAAMSRVSPEILSYVAQVGVDVSGILRTIVISGVVLAILALIGSLDSSRSLTSLSAKLSSTLVTLYLGIYLLSLGKPSTLGRVILTQPTEGTEMSLLLDFRGIILLLVVGTIFSASYHIATFWSACREAGEPA